MKSSAISSKLLSADDLGPLPIDESRLQDLSFLDGLTDSGHGGATILPDGRVKSADGRIRTPGVSAMLLDDSAAAGPDGSLTGFGREVQHLTQNGYHYDAITGKMVPN